MKKIIGIMLVLIFWSCGSTRVITTKEGAEKYGNTSQPGVQVVVSVPEKEKPTNSGATTSSPQPKLGEVPANSTNKIVNYVAKYGTIAKYEMQQTGIPASITLAQGILESGAGEGDLTRRANNHFGIKCHGWEGEKVYHDDDKKQECFRKYAHPRESFHDHSVFLTSHSRYAFLFQLPPTDYKAWAKGLRRAGYATDPKYPQKLISLIERYNLNAYDTGVKAQVNEWNTETAPKNTSTYTVKKGDTLYSIAIRNQISVERLMELNQLNNSHLELGQQLIVK